MVFIVKFPARKVTSQTQDAAAEPNEAVHTTQEATTSASMTLPVATPLMDSSPTHSDTSNKDESPSTKEPSIMEAKKSVLDVLLAPSVLKHRYVRGVDKSNIVERPERIRAVLLGLAGAHGVSEKMSSGSTRHDNSDLVSMLSSMTMEERESAVRVMKATRTLSLDAPEAALMDVHGYANEPAVYSVSTEYAPSDENNAGPSTHLARASSLAAKAPHEAPGTLPRKALSASADLSDATSSDGEGDERMHLCEIPENLPQGDLYLCGPHTASAQDSSDGGSREAICHALGACIEAVDRVVAGAKDDCPVHWSEQVQPQSAGLDDVSVTRVVPHQPAKRAFVLSRPPGHHCSGAEPSGFCWVNNAVVAAAHAYRAHKIDRIVVLDIDLHHGNGTQALVWRMNADAVEADQRRQAKFSSTLRQANKGATPATRSATKAAEAVRTPYEQLQHEESLVGPRAQRLFYGSLHDIESYPCENGDTDLIRNASVCLAGAHGQWIWNGTYSDPAARGCRPLGRPSKRSEGASRHPATTGNRYLSSLAPRIVLTEQCILTTTKTTQSLSNSTGISTRSYSSKRAGSCVTPKRFQSVRWCLFPVALMRAHTNTPVCSAMENMYRPSFMHSSLATPWHSRMNARTARSSACWKAAIRIAP